MEIHCRLGGRLRVRSQITPGTGWGRSPRIARLRRLTDLGSESGQPSIWAEYGVAAPIWGWVYVTTLHRLADQGAPSSLAAMVEPRIPDTGLQLHRRHGTMVIDYILIEQTSTGMSLAQELRSLNVRPISIPVDGDKISRMNRWLARMEAGSVSLPRSASWLEEFECELMTFPEGPHDDQADALSQGLNYVWIRKMRRVGYRMVIGAY